VGQRGHKKGEDSCWRKWSFWERVEGLLN
jgi:hypothetical protein